MRRNLLLAFWLAAAFLAGYGHGRWYAKTISVAAKTLQRPLYYRCPMHPAYRSDSPGASPCCNMALEPVYSDASLGTTSGPSTGALLLTAEQQQLTGVQFGIVEYGPISRVTRGSGRVGVNENHVARIQTKLEGFIDRIYVHAAGERVTQGQLLLSIYNRRTYGMAQMQFLEASMEAAGMTTPSTQGRAIDRRVANEALQSARQQLDMMGFTSAQIDAVARAQQPLFSIPLHAPINGVILELNATLNGKPGMEPLLTIADLSTVWITASFPTGSAIHPGQSATLTVADLPREVFHGVVESIAPQFDGSVAGPKALFQFENPAGLLKLGMYGEIELRSAALKKLTVPTEAIIERGRTQTVFVDRGAGLIAPRAVKIGERFGDRVEILDGLQPGQRIVTSGMFLLDSESQIRASQR